MVTVKQTAKKAPAKKAVKTVEKKASAKKPAKVAQTSVPAKNEPEEAKVIKRVPPRIIRKAPPPPPVVAEYTPIDTAKAVAFAMSIAQEMKRSAAQAEERKGENDIKLSRRPTTRTQGKTTEKFPVADLKEFRKRLLAAREQALSGVNVLKDTGFNEADDHEADGGDGTNQTLRLQALGQIGDVNRTLQQIEEALHRIDDGTYGVCTVCGQLIRKPRLMNRPFVLTCMECQSEMERARK